MHRVLILFIPLGTLVLGLPFIVFVTKKFYSSFSVLRRVCGKPIHEFSVSLFKAIAATSISVALNVLYLF